MFARCFRSGDVEFRAGRIEPAVRQAQAAAGGTSVGVHGGDTIRQLLDAGLLDEARVGLVQMPLGAGVRLFGRPVRAPSALNGQTVIAGVGVTHLRYPVREVSP
ncbi:MAG: hypothetical protein ACNA8N_01300 [Trueperaceae bacterium]